MEYKAWEGFQPGEWQESINVRDFIQKNYTPYEGDESFLTEPTQRTQELNHRLSNLLKLEQEFGGVLDIDTETVSSPYTRNTPSLCVVRKRNSSSTLLDK